MAGYELNTSATLVVFAFDVITGLGKTGDAANLTLYRKEKGGTVVQVTDTSFTELSPTNAPGYYEVDLAGGEIDQQYTHFFPKSSTTSPNNVGVVVAPPLFTTPVGFYNATNTVALNMATTLPGSPTADTVGAALKRASVGLPLSAPGAAGGLALYDDLFSVVATGTLATVTGAGDMTLDASFAASDNYYTGMFLVPQSGNAAKQPRAISVYTGSTKRCQFTGTGSQITRPFSTAPTAGDPVKILGLSGTI